VGKAVSANAAVLFALVPDHVRTVCLLESQRLGLESEGAATGVCASTLARDLRERIALAVIGDVEGRDKGLALVRKVRQNAPRAHIVFLTSEELTKSVRPAVYAGADDVFPYSEECEHVVTKLMVLAVSKGQLETLSVGCFELDPKMHEIRMDNEPLDLTASEYECFRVILQNADRIVTEQVLKQEALRRRATSPRRAEAHVRTLRKKINAHDDSDTPIRRKRGKGWFFDETWVPPSRRRVSEVVPRNVSRAQPLGEDAAHGPVADKPCPVRVSRRALGLRGFRQMKRVELAANG
jgi:DNA-binding response OmpR family regulator